ncbi:DUF5693 family protein [Planomicrobium sp. MB-3u-38]|uniref:DUF5693 family protein n=1 Tax=Planomicrobium sp. MB-3u-38 TaxID=2058318 RepID=UPI000C7A887C|nr:DUF5693 family protein [Planomicrobium sp. MB-3u-38]PKH09078.1 hypothetical protein CXF70_13960 [Planomicrobium sp. MB-3u-38]
MQKVLIGIILAAMILTIPSIYNRVQVEESNKTVETIVPYKYIMDWMIKDPELDQERILSQLQDYGIDTISMEPDTLSTLRKKGDVTVISVSTMNELLIFNKMKPLMHPFDKEGIFIHANQESSFEELTKNVFEDTRQITVEDVDYTFVPGEVEKTFDVPVGYDSDVVEAVMDAGMEVVPRIGDYKNTADTERMAEELLELKQPGIEKVLFMGNESPFYSEPEKLKEFSSRLSDAGYSIFSTEFAAPKGFQTAAYTMDMDVIRLHSQGLAKGNAFDIADKFTRGAKERNIRAFFINPNFDEYAEAKEEFEKLNNEIEAQLPSAFERGSSGTYDEIGVPLWQIALGLIGSIAFLAWAAQTVFGNRKLTLAAVAVLTLLALIYLVTDMTIILKVFALGLAVTTPVFAVLLKKNTESKYYLLSSYFKAVGITLIGIWLIVVLLNGNAFILGVDAFRGVKLVYFLPIVFLVLYALWGNMEKIMKANVTYGHLIVMGLVGAIVFFYLSRTGNEGSVLPYELEFRMFLEDLLYVRPRTKEFLIGLPIFLLALEVAKKYRTMSYYLLIPAVIGFLSMVNTFTHFHIPLSISLLRTGYSVVLGLLIGLILVFLYRWASQKIITELNRRWQR